KHPPYAAQQKPQDSVFVNPSTVFHRQYFPPPVSIGFAAVLPRLYLLFITHPVSPPTAITLSCLPEDNAILI
ncbi:hypothetical protein OHC99_00255, partial [Escherichia coli]